MAAADSSGVIPRSLAAATASSSGGATESQRKVRRTVYRMWDVSLGTDFAGLEAPRIALQNMGFLVRHRFSCEINKSCVKLAEHTWGDVEQRFHDIVERNNSMLPETDLYVAGVPCQSWSRAGPQSGLQDPRGRLWVHTLDSIVKSRPKAVVLENVVGMMDQKFRPIFDDIVQTLRDADYDVHHAVLNTASHGIPQVRLRLFFVCIRRAALKAPFTWPAPLPRTIPLRKLLGGDPRHDGPLRSYLPPLSLPSARENVRLALQRLLQKRPKMSPLDHDIVVDIGCTARFANYKVDCFPTITAERAANFGWWLVRHGRRIDLPDLLKLQGIPADFFDFEGAGVSKQRVAHMCGNAMSVNVLERLLPKVLASIGVHASTPQGDTWMKLCQ